MLIVLEGLDLKQKIFCKRFNISFPLKCVHSLLVGLESLSKIRF